MENKEVAKILRETAQLLEIDGAIIGRYRSYEKVAELLDGLTERIEDIAKDDKKLQELPGIGEGMTAHIHEILKTGDYSLRQKLQKKYPPRECTSRRSRRWRCSGRNSKWPPLMAWKNSRARASCTIFPGSAKRASRIF